MAHITTYRRISKLIADGHRLLADLSDLILAELTWGRDPGTITVSVGGENFHISTVAEGNMEQTIAGKAVGDVLTVEASAPKDAHGRPTPGGGTWDFTVDDPSVLGLELDPADVAAPEGGRAARVTILDERDGVLTVSYSRPTKGPLTATVNFTDVQPLTDDAAVEFDVQVMDALPTPEPVPTPEPTPGPAPAAGRLAPQTGAPLGTTRPGQPPPRRTGF
jgi:hypothetical protein